MKIAITGTTNGLGQWVSNTLQSQHDIIRIDRKNYDLSKIQNFENLDLTGVDTLICNAGFTKGDRNTLKNLDNETILNQLNIHLINNLFLIKKYISDNTKGHIIVINSAVINRYKNLHFGYALSKHCMHNAFKLLQNLPEIQNFYLSEINPSRTKTNIHKQDKNFKYNEKDLNVEQVGKQILFCIDNPNISTLSIGLTK